MPKDTSVTFPTAKGSPYQLIPADISRKFRTERFSGEARPGAEYEEANAKGVESLSVADIIEDLDALSMEKVS